MSSSTRKRAATIGTAGAAILLMLGALLWQTLTGDTARSRPPAAVSAIDTYQRACLLTDGKSAATTTARVWAGMRQGAAQHGDLLVQRYLLPKGVSPTSYFNTLSQMQCGTIVTIGAALRDAVASDARRSSFVVITDRPVDAPHVVSLTPAQVTETVIETAVTTDRR
jgi:hypothetical protein